MSAVLGTVGLLLLSITSWLPEIGPMLSRIIRRVNMIASGKMFVANVLPTMMLNLFDWNPLFHVIDQARGFAFGRSKGWRMGPREHDRLLPRPP